MTNQELFSQAIADAKAVRDAAVANAKAALEETFTPKIMSMLSAKLNEMEEDLEEKKEVYIYEEEMKQAIKIEKSKYRFRVTLLKYWGLNCLKNLRKIASNIYNKLDDWIILSIKAENEAVSQLITILKNAIEKEQKIKYELEWSFK